MSKLRSNSDAIWQRRARYLTAIACLIAFILGLATPRIHQPSNAPDSLRLVSTQVP